MIGPFKLAAISDIHGNFAALKAVLADAEKRGITHIANLGDSLYGPLEPSRTADLLIECKIKSICGNEDRILLFPPEDTSDLPSLAFALRSLTSDHKAWLASLPPTLEAFDCCFLCHGTPSRDNRYFLSEVTPSSVRLRATKELQKEASHIGKPIILCGHDHTPNVCRLPDGRLVVNPGSVGLQAYVDYFPWPHVMQTGSPHARYAVIQRSANSWDASIVKVPYDWMDAAGLATANGRPDWAVWLRTGRAISN